MPLFRKFGGSPYLKDDTEPSFLLPVTGNRTEGVESRHGTSFKMKVYSELYGDI